MTMPSRTLADVSPVVEAVSEKLASKRITSSSSTFKLLL